MPSSARPSTGNGAPTSRKRPSSSQGTASSPTAHTSSSSSDMKWFGYQDIATFCSRTMEERFPLPTSAPEIDDSASDTLLELSSSGCHINRGEEEEDPSATFAEWVAYVLYRTVLPMHTVFHALHIINRLSGYVADGRVLPCALSPPPVMEANGKPTPPRKNQLHYRLFLSALILCTTYSMDDAYANKSWAIASKFVFDIKTINRMEFELFRALEWQLAADGEHITEIVQAYEADWRAGLKQQARLKAQRDHERKRHELRRLPSAETPTVETFSTPQPSPGISISSGRTSWGGRTSAPPSVPPSPACPPPARPPSREQAPRRTSGEQGTPAPPPRATTSRPPSRPASRQSSSGHGHEEEADSRGRRGRESARPESRASSRRRSLSAGIREAFSKLRSSSRDRSRDRGGESSSRAWRGLPSPTMRRSGEQPPDRRQSEDKARPPVPPPRQRRTSTEARTEARWLGFQLGSLTRRPLPRPPTATAASAPTVPVTTGEPVHRSTTCPEPAEELTSPSAPDTTPRPTAQWARGRMPRSKPPVALRRMASQPCMQSARLNFVSAAG